MKAAIVEGVKVAALRLDHRKEDAQRRAIGQSCFGARVEKGQPLATLYATTPALLPEPIALLKQAITLSKAPPGAVALVSRIFNRETAENYLRNAVR